MPEIYDYAEHDFVLQGEPETTPVIIAADQVIPARTPLKLNTTSGEYEIADVTASKAVRMSVYPIDTTGAAKEAQVYKQGQFNIGLVNWPTAADTAAKKTLMFAGSEIAVGMLHAI